MPNFGLSSKNIHTVRQILVDYPAIEKAVIYGSRAKGTQKPGSDIDLTLFGEEITSAMLRQITARLHESAIPYTVDLSIYTELDNVNLREHIDRVGRTFYARDDAK